MSDFSDSPTPILLDPYRRVRYTHGLVLGVPEFEQEQLYFLEKGQVHTRALHGYGTVNGLKLEVKSGPELTVAPGLAVNPIGQLIRITRTQCANLSTWLGRAEVRTTLQTSQGDATPAVDANGNGHVTVHVVLCYDECAVDPVTIPGAACRSQDDSVTPSRTVDSFRLSLSFSPPEQLEETAVRDFGELLRRIVVAEEGGPYTTEAELLALVRALIPVETGEKADEVEGEEGNQAPLRIHPDDACEIYCAMLRVWITEVRAAINGSEGGTVTPTEACVLLGTLDFDITGWAPPADLGLYTLDETQRPMLAHTRLLQEWLSCGQATHSGESLHTFATLTGLDARSPYELLAWVHHPLQLTIPAAAIGVSIDNEWLDPSQYSIQAMDSFNVFRIQFNNWANYKKPGARRPAGRERLLARRKASDAATSNQGGGSKPSKDAQAASAPVGRPQPGLPGSLTHLDDRVEGSDYYYYGYQLYDGARVVVRFDATQITVAEFDGSLWDQMGERRYNLDRDDKVLSARLVADLPALDDLQDVMISGELIPGQGLLFDGYYWRPGDVMHPGDAAGGDLSGSYPNPMVTGLRNIPIQYPEDLKGFIGEGILTLRPDDQTGAHWEPVLLNALLGKGNEGDVLTLVNGTWQAQAPGNQEAATGDVSGVYPALTVIGIGGYPVKLPRTMTTGSMLFFSGDTTSGTWAVGKPGGDLAGNYPAPAVSGILGFPIANKVTAPPADGSLLRFSARIGQWELVTAIGSASASVTSFADVFWSSDGMSATLRFHIQLGAQTSDPGVLLNPQKPGLTIMDDQTGDVLRFSLRTSTENTAVIVLEAGSSTSRFARLIFDTSLVMLDVGKPLQAYCDEKHIQFVGQDVVNRTITLYSLIPAQVAFK